MARTIINLNRDWRFIREDVPEAASPSFDDSRWQRIGLPHTFDLPYFRTPEFYVGVGWYRKRFSHSWPSSTEPREGRVFLEFDGVFQVCEIYVNGQHVDGHRGGYTGFSIDITDAIRDGDNILAIRVDNNWNARLAPRAGEHIFSGGIYRDVRLVVTNHVSIPWCGQSITTADISRDHATVRVQTLLRNQSLAPSPCVLRTRVTDANDAIVAERESTISVTPDSATLVDQSLAVANPQLWHPDHPHLYRLISEVLIDNLVVDQLETPFGIRYFEWTPDRGFFLNGEHLYLRGANAHQDHAGWGIGITRAACERDVRLIKDAGFNFVRGAHYPHHPAFAGACDRLGVLFWSEATFWGKGGFGPEGYWNASAYPTNAEDAAEFEQSCLDQLREMILINRNHPSIIAWSMCNEPFFTYHLERAKELLKKMVALSRELDPTRPAAIGGAQRGAIDHIGDIAGYNGDGARLFIDPGVPNMVSEYGAISKPLEAFEPFFGDLQQEKFPWRGGEAIWCGFDYGTIAGKQGLKGILTHARLPKRSWHWYRQHNLNIDSPPTPVAMRPDSVLGLRLEADKALIEGTDATDDVQLIVSFINQRDERVDASEPITLTIESGPGEFPTGRSVTFAPDTDIAMFHGQAAIAFRSYHGGRSVIRAAARGATDATIEIDTIGEPRFRDPSLLNDERPYTPPDESEVAKAALRNAVNIALNRPSRASSEQPNSPARAANDGVAETSWQAADGDTAPWWMLDLEGFYELASIKLLFPAGGNWRFFAETSLDGKTWSQAIDRRQSINEAAARTDVFEPGLSARYLRVTFTKIPVAHAGMVSVEVYGILSR